MSYKALYRTYRPSTFTQVAGQQHIVKTLMNALKENNPDYKFYEVLGGGNEINVESVSPSQRPDYSTLQTLKT